MNDLSIRNLAIFEGFIIIIQSMLLFCLPLATFHVEGTITDFISNDNGFGLKIDDVCYWLSYNGEINFSPYTDVGKRCKLAYTSSLLFPRGEIPFYADTIYLEVYD